MGQTVSAFSIQLKVISAWSGEASWKREGLFWSLRDEQHGEKCRGCYRHEDAVAPRSSI